jgi:hypothetical protein
LCEWIAEGLVHYEPQYVWRLPRAPKSAFRRAWNRYLPRRRGHYIGN